MKDLKEVAHPQVIFLPNNEGWILREPAPKWRYLPIAFDTWVSNLPTRVCKQEDVQLNTVPKVYTYSDINPMSMPWPIRKLEEFEYFFQISPFTNVIKVATFQELSVGGYLGE